jgi:hypothetical protein
MPEPKPTVDFEREWPMPGRTASIRWSSLAARVIAISDFLVDFLVT